MDNVRLVLIILLSFVSLLLWEAWQKDHATPPASRAAATSGAETPAEAARPPSDLPAPIRSKAPLPEAAATPAAAPATLIDVQTDLFAIQINPVGGVLERVELKAYPVDVDHPDIPFALFANDPFRFFVQQSGLKAMGDSPDHYATYSAEQGSYRLQNGADELAVGMTWRSSDGVEVRKIFVFKRGAYDIRVRYEIHNASGAPWTAHHYDQLQRQHVDKKSYFANTYTGAALSTLEKRYEKHSFKDLTDEPLDTTVKNGWLAILEHYFVAAIIPDPEQNYTYYSTIVDGQRYVVGYYGPEISVPAGATMSVESRAYIGPKLQDLLPGIAPGLELTVDYGVLWFIAKMLFWTLEAIHGVLGNWGWAIIVLTLFVKLLFYPLSAAGYRSMAKMRRVQPRLVAIRDRYANDRARLNQAMMELYKQEKINPLGGCLPILVQIPVFISLYWVLLESVELRQASWIFWIHDLSVKDPYFVLPVLMTISMWLQTRLNPAPLDPMQAKVMQIMPWAFGVFFAFFPAGLVLYWFVNNVLSIAQQWTITRHIEREQPAR